MTITDTTIERPAPVEQPDTIAAVEKFAAAGDRIAELAAAQPAGGLRRRLEKLARQQHAASRLLYRGRFLDPLTTRLSPSLVPGETIGEIDYRIDVSRNTIRRLHTWRGHTSSLPAAD